ncbi:Ferredoxin:CoB-CoM heterodisulfide reductase, subunit A [Desulfonema limicola]|uniref:Ferredoxin:CoB-CoM heterodisulfide reductase, subunit A n=1 Tax=Desulfonema limicola TaxID=45656 RepID=A0A975GGZ4_9BACT|nr:CoB--CoM heterodisulfide reductase iron-sulfur subunit A family protein [Desulfonema limicola]QTA80865.1 Ferredoxin:CoB-CoM heterodisulfide reductase, subunit A [Desulfonema limicola]
MSIKTNSIKRGSVVITGGGIGGMQAALDLAESGFKVHMIQRESSIGGTMAMLDKTFPTGDCSMCMISPKMVEVGRHPNIKIHTLAEVIKVTGEPGDFTVTIHEKARFVNPDLCTGCGACEKKCPKLVTSEFEQGLAKRKAIFTILPQAVPLTRVIDKDNCIYLTKGKCRACEKFCEVNAINFDDTDKEYNLQVGAIILSPGLDRYNPQVRGELGFGRWPNVVTSIQFERILSASGPFMGEIKRPSDERHPAKIAWIQCVGSRDKKNANPWCSSVCCMYATKQAVIAKEHDGSINPTIFYMEMRAFGKDFDKYVDRAKNQYGVTYRRAMVSDIKEQAGTGNLILRYSQANGTLVEEIFDMAVLSIGFEPHKEALEFAKTFGIESNIHRFAKTTAFEPVQTTRPGIFVTGTYQGPKDIPETVAQGSAVAGSSMALLGEARGTEITIPELPPETDVTETEPRIGVFVCHCGINIAHTVDVKKVADEMRTQPNVTYSDDLMYACAPDGQEKIKDLIKEHNLNRVIVASCTPRTHAPLFQDTIRDAGLNKYLFELADIREQCSWCHMGQNEAATKKASEIVKMNVAKARLLSPVQTDSVDVTPAALVIGGGIAGMTSALALADQGYQVHIVEKQEKLGGLANNVYKTLDNSDVQAFVKQRITDVQAHPRITTHLNTEIDNTGGFVGNFKTVLTTGETFLHGAIIIASGGMEYEPSEYSYKESQNIITQRELEKQIAQGLNPAQKHFLMIQCVGSREEPDNYCSRICCQDAIKNAIAIKEKSPEAQVTILYRDIRTYGLREDYYQKARELGVLFVRFETNKKPEVKVNSSRIQVKVFDYVINQEITFTPDMVILSTGLRPHPSTEKLGKQYKLTVNPDGYFLEAHVKLRPVDFPSEGLFVAGLAHAPKNIDETISQSLAAAGRAGVLLSHDKLGVSGIISKHNRDLCMSCLACFRVCPFGSPFIDEDGKISHNEVICTGCGICAGICPAKAFQVNSFRDDQIIAMIDAATENTIA